MRAALVLALGALLAQEPAEPPSESNAPQLRPAGKRRALGGLSGLRATSTVVFAGRPDDPHRLEVVLQFPDRDRWLLTREGAAGRRIEFRYGEHAYVVQNGERVSVQPSAAEREEFLRRMALRRAVLMWPEAAPWTGDESGSATRTAPIHALAADLDDPARPAIGSLEARLAEDGRPREVRALRPDGSPQESLAITAWGNAGGRAFPTGLRLVLGDQVIWEETVELDTRAIFRDGYFLPADRQGLLPKAQRFERRVLPPVTVRRIPLEGAPGWEAALGRARALILEASPRMRTLGHGVVPLPVLVLDAEGIPREVVLRLTTAVAPPPEGWTAEPRTQALRMTLEGVSPPEAEHLEDLRATLPPGREELDLWVEVGSAQVALDLRLR